LGLSFQEIKSLYGPDVCEKEHLWQKRDMFLRIPAVPSITGPALKAAQQMGALTDSITEGRGNRAGKIAEYAVNMLFDCQWADEYDYDFIMRKNWIKRYPQYSGRCDVKAKDRKEDNFLPSWEVSVSDKAGLGIRQKTDFYFLCSVSFNMNLNKPYGLPLYIWLLGFLSKDHYLYGLDPSPQTPNELDVLGNPVIRFDNRKDGAEFRKKGNPYDFNGFICSSDCWNRKASDLDPLKLKDLNNPYSFRALQKIIKEAREYTLWQEPTDILLGQKIFTGFQNV
jgi:hypothetical protein